MTNRPFTSFIIVLLALPALASSFARADILPPLGHYASLALSTATEYGSVSGGPTDPGAILPGNPLVEQARTLTDAPAGQGFLGYPLITAGVGSTITVPLGSFPTPDGLFAVRIQGVPQDVFSISAVPESNGQQAPTPFMVQHAVQFAGSSASEVIFVGVPLATATEWAVTNAANDVIARVHPIPPAAAASTNSNPAATPPDPCQGQTPNPGCTPPPPDPCNSGGCHCTPNTYFFKLVPKMPTLNTTDPERDNVTTSAKGAGDPNFVPYWNSLEKGAYDLWAHLYMYDGSCKELDMGREYHVGAWSFGIEGSQDIQDSKNTGVTGFVVGQPVMGSGVSSLFTDPYVHVPDSAAGNAADYSVSKATGDGQLPYLANDGISTSSSSPLAQDAAEAAIATAGVICLIPGLDDAAAAGCSLLGLAEIVYQASDQGTAPVPPTWTDGHRCGEGCMDWNHGIGDESLDAGGCGISMTCSGNDNAGSYVLHTAIMPLKNGPHSSHNILVDLGFQNMCIGVKDDSVDPPVASPQDPTAPLHYCFWYSYGLTSYTDTYQAWDGLDNVPPHKPWELTATASGSNSITLKWFQRQTPGIDFYVYRGTSPGHETLLTPTPVCADLDLQCQGTDGSTTWPDSTAPGGVKLYYTVAASYSKCAEDAEQDPPDCQALNGAAGGTCGTGQQPTVTRCWSAQSNEANAETFQPPSAPSSISLWRGQDQLCLSLAPPASSGDGQPIASYDISRGTVTRLESHYTTISAGSGGFAQYCDSFSSGQEGASYYYVVYATNSHGQTSAASSSEVSGTVAGVPDAPLVGVASGNGRVTLSWSAPAAHGDAIASYGIYRGPAGSETYYASVPTSASATGSFAFVDSNVANGQTYSYRVAASNNIGLGPQRNEVTATPTGPAGAPGAPTGLTVYSGDASLQLSWKAPSSNGGSPITGYRVYRSTQSGAETLLTSGGCSNLGNVLNCIDSGLTNGVVYDYVVTAMNGVGESPWSQEAAGYPFAGVGP
jgi:fibronectin type 3 domain-containing protein